MRYVSAVCRVLFVVAFMPAALFAQDGAPARPYAVTFGGGLALTGGNTDTKNFNLAFGLVRDPKTRNVIKFNALYLRGSQNDILNLDKTSVILRDELTVSNRTFLFGQVDYLRDEFKNIQYLLSPAGGVGFKLADGENTKFALSGGAGGVWENNPGVPVNGSGSLNAGQTFSQRLSSNATLTQSVTGLWKTDDFTDSLTNFAIGLATSINGQMEVKIEFLDSYKNRPSGIGVRKNDTAFVTSFVVKFE